VTPSIQKKIRLGTGGKRRFPRQVRRTPTPIVTVGTTVINDKDDRASHELDVVALVPGTVPGRRGG
jgi:hypothetical protein